MSIKTPKNLQSRYEHRLILVNKIWYQSNTFFYQQETFNLQTVSPPLFHLLFRGFWQVELASWSFQTWRPHTWWPFFPKKNLNLHKYALTWLYLNYFHIVPNSLKCLPALFVFKISIDIDYTKSSDLLINEALLNKNFPYQY